MSNVKYTPGPWKIERYKTKSGLVQTIIQSENNNVCRMDISGRDPGTLMSDTRLIAAAPDLLAVTEDLKKYLDFVEGGLTTNSTVEYELYHRLGVAIRAAKATA